MHYLGEKWVNISAVRPLLNHILDTLLNPSDDDIALAKEMKLAIYHFDTSHQRKPQGYISNIPWEQVYIMIYPAAMVTSQ